MPLRIRPATLNDLDAARALFAAYPYKTAQVVAQKLDKERLVDFYLAGLRSALEKGTPHWIVEDAAGTPLALAGLSPDPWHSGVYGFPMGKIAPFLGARASSPAPESHPHAEAPAGEEARASRLLLSTLESAARDQNLKHLSARIDGEDFPTLHLFQSAGWLLVDVSLKFTRPFGSAVSGQNDSSFRIPHSEFRIELASPDDGAWIRELGSRTHAGTHFLNDPAFPADRTRELFARWLDRCIDGLAYRIYVLRDPSGTGRGFVTYLRAGGFARAVGRTPLILDFVLVDPALRGGGFGPWLIAESLARESGGGFDYCELRTSAHNLSAVMTYEKLGFRCCASDFALHRTIG